MASSICLSKANTCFSFDLFKILSEDDKIGNVCYSPFSISSALALVLLGARGNTATQISEVLHFTEAERPPQEPSIQQQIQTQSCIPMQMQQRSRLPQYLQKMLLKMDCNQNEYHDDFAKLMNRIISADTPYTLSLANRLYGEKSYTYLVDFLAETTKYYKADLESVDFKGSTENTRISINNWVEEQTEGKIKDLIASGVLDNLTKLVLVNAIYFKGKWCSPFEEEFTQDAQFRLSKNETRPVKMMLKKNRFHFTQIPEVNCQILELPYEGRDMNMLIFLPNDIEDETTGLEKLVKELTYDNFVRWTQPHMMSHVEVEVKLPRFKMESQYNLEDVLISMGMVDAFDVSTSDFSGMSSANDLIMSKVIHKAFVEVNEEGTEAAAASSAVMENRMIMIPTVFNADHPFLFYIRHNPTMSILFAGRYTSPE